MSETAEQFAARIDAQSVAQLRARGSLKWSAYPGLLPAWVAESDFGLAEPVRLALQSALDDELTGYVPLAMRTELKRACADFQAERYGWQVDPARVFWLPDVLTGLAIALNHLVPAGPVVVPTPCYMPFMDMPRVFHRELVEVPMLRGAADWRLDLSGIDRALARGARLVVLCNPHNPIGKVYSESELLELAEVVEAHGAAVFSDEIHAPLTMPGHRHQPYAALSPVTAEHTITAVAASKAWNLAGLKCAQLILTRPTDAQAWGNAGHGIPYEASVLGTVASIAAYRQGGEWLDNELDYLEHNLQVVAELMARLLPEVPFIRPAATYLVWLDLSGFGLGADPTAVLRERAGIALTSGSECGAVGAGHVRINCATTTAVLREIIERLAQALRQPR